jgi:hypothetical protein
MESTTILAIAGISLLFLFYLMYKNYKSQKKIVNKHSINRNSVLHGNYDIRCKIDNQPVLPFMFTNLSKKFVSNENCKWNLKLKDKSKKLYSIIHPNNNAPVCAYINDSKVCLYPLDKDSVQQNSNDHSDSDCDKPTICSTDDLIPNTPEFNENNSLFEITEIQTGFYTIKKDGLFVCKEDNVLSLSDNVKDTCIWIIN